jgi:membrane protease YdiL (CAAX protease family)
LIFRGLLLDWLKQKINVRLAAVILSAAFALLHYNGFSHGAIGWILFGGRFFIGLAASAFAIKYRSLRPSTILHGTLNGIGCVYALLSNA